MKPLLTCLLLLVLAGCQRESAPVAPGAPAPDGGATTPVAAPPPRAPLADVIERDPRYVVGITFPKNIDRYPGLADALRAYADAARAELRQAVDGAGAAKPPSPYDLSLAFNTTVDTPQIVAVAADGSSYTGGAHGNPLVARFVWLPQQQKALKIDALIADKAGWQALSDYVREQLHAALSQRIDADELDPAERAEMMQSALKMIDEGSGPQAENFAQFEPLLDGAGKLTGLRFVFPPYQVGPYSDGVQSVDVPAAVLSPHLAAEYKPLFATG